MSRFFDSITEKLTSLSFLFPSPSPFKQHLRYILLKHTKVGTNIKMLTKSYSNLFAVAEEDPLALMRALFLLNADIRLAPPAAQVSLVGAVLIEQIVFQKILDIIRRNSNNLDSLIELYHLIAFFKVSDEQELAPTTLENIKLVEQSLTSKIWYRIGSLADFDALVKLRLKAKQELERYYPKPDSAYLELDQAIVKKMISLPDIPQLRHDHEAFLFSKEYDIFTRSWMCALAVFFQQEREFCNGLLAMEAEERPAALDSHIETLRSSHRYYPSIKCWWFRDFYNFWTQVKSQNRLAELPEIQPTWRTKFAGKRTC